MLFCPIYPNEGLIACKWKKNRIFAVKNELWAFGLLNLNIIYGSKECTFIDVACGFGGGRMSGV